MSCKSYPMKTSLGFNKFIIHCSFKYTSNHPKYEFLWTERTVNWLSVIASNCLRWLLCLILHILDGRGKDCIVYHEYQTLIFCIIDYTQYSLPFHFVSLPFILCKIAVKLLHLLYIWIDNSKEHYIKCY